MVILDTNIIIDHLRQPDVKETKLIGACQEYSKESLALSVLSIQELYEGRSTRDEEKEEYLLATIAPLRILPYTFEVAQLAGKIARDSKRPVELADAAIAATTIINRAQLFTLNKKGFGGVEGLELI